MVSDRYILIQGSPFQNPVLDKSVEGRQSPIPASGLRVFFPLRDPGQVPGNEFTHSRIAGEDAGNRIAIGSMGETSGLSADGREDLERWNDGFHLEMHGGSVSLTQEPGETKGWELAERGGFEPPVDFIGLRRFSKPLLSTTQPPLREM